MSLTNLTTPLDIRTYLNTSSEEVYAKKFNIYIGVSLGNKYFSEENLKKYILWAIKNSKECAAVLIPDKIHAVNYEVRDKYKTEKALRTALRKGEEKKNIVTKILEELDDKDRKKIVIVRWDTIEKDPDYLKVKEEIYNEFNNNSNFQNKLINIVKNNLNSQLPKFSDEGIKKLASYPLDELPVLINGFTFNGIHFDLIPYPGISEIDHLTVDLQNGISFKELSKKIATHKVALIEAYAT